MTKRTTNEAPCADPHSVFAMCVGKEKFTRARARKFARERNARNTKRGRKPIGAYKCPHCAAWHVGIRR